MKKLLDDCGPCATGELHYFSWENFGFYLFIAYIRGGFKEIKEINKESSKIVVSKRPCVLVAAKNCVK
jgi:hypothetical protein